MDLRHLPSAGWYLSDEEDPWQQEYPVISFVTREGGGLVAMIYRNRVVEHCIVDEPRFDLSLTYSDRVAGPDVAQRRGFGEQAGGVISRWR